MVGWLPLWDRGEACGARVIEGAPGRNVLPGEEPAGTMA